MKSGVKRAQIAVLGVMLAGVVVAIAVVSQHQPSARRVDMNSDPNNGLGTGATYAAALAATSKALSSAETYSSKSLDEWRKAATRIGETKNFVLLVINSPDDGSIIDLEYKFDGKGLSLYSAGRRSAGSKTSESLRFKNGALEFYAGSNGENETIMLVLEQSKPKEFRVFHSEGYYDVSKFDENGSLTESSKEPLPAKTPPNAE